MQLGRHGADVRKLQLELRHYDPHLAADGFFGARTERATRLAQRRLKLYPPDGVAGPITLAALGRHAVPKPGNPAPVPRPHPMAPASHPVTPDTGNPGSLKPTVDPARDRAADQPMPAGDARPVAGMQISLFGRLFIVKEETWAGVSNHLHHPSEGSGVTIGPGYDMKDRSAAEISADLQAIKVLPAAANAAAAGAGLSGAAADKFAKDNQALLNLSDAQEAQLLVHIVGHYESMVRKAITIPLHQYEFDALVSFAYNPGGGWRQTVKFVNEHKVHEAMMVVSQQFYSQHKVLGGLVERRAKEVRLFQYGEYR